MREEAGRQMESRITRIGGGAICREESCSLVNKVNFDGEAMQCPCDRGDLPYSLVKVTIRHRLQKVINFHQVGLVYCLGWTQSILIYDTGSRSAVTTNSLICNETRV